MKKIELLLFITALFLSLLLSSCGQITQIQNSLSDDFIRYIATAYNCGIETNFDDLKKIADSDSYYYDDKVLEYFKYFNGELSIETLFKMPSLSLKLARSQDQRIKNYIISTTQEFINHSASSVVIDQYDENIPAKPTNEIEKSMYDYLNPTVITFYEKRDFLIGRVYDLIKRDYNSFGLFRSWFDEFYPNESLSDSDIKYFSEFLVDTAYAYTHSKISLPRLHFTSSDSYPSVIELDQIPVELLFAIVYQESRFFPGSYRTETNNENIYALSLGLAHVLIDSDYLDLAIENEDIGNGTKDSYTFSQISYYYLGNSRNSEDIFSDVDLLMIRGAFLYSAIYLDMIYQKLSKIISKAEIYEY